MTRRVEGKVAFITGAARGQGRSHAVRLAAEGADIIAVDLCAPVRGVLYEPASEEDLAETVRQVESLGRTIVASTVDVRDLDALKAAVAGGVSSLGRLDIVVANAGICIMSRWDEATSEMFRDTVEINLVGTWNTVMSAAPHVVDAGGGSIILVSSVAGLKAQPFLIPYVAAKHGVTGLARAFAQELAKHHIRVNSIHPTGVDTDMGGPVVMQGLMEMMEEDPRIAPIFTNTLPVDLITADDVSNVVVYLASDESRYVTASAIPIDAGATQY